jgi:hypothetical protein
MVFLSVVSYIEHSFQVYFCLVVVYSIYTRLFIRSVSDEVLSNVVLTRCIFHGHGQYCRSLVIHTTCADLVISYMTVLKTSRTLSFRRILIMSK